MKKTLSIAAYLCFIYLFILSVLLYQERTIVIDTANYVMSLLNSGGNFFVGKRYTGDILLIIPGMLVYLGASLKAVLLSYSISSVLIPFLIFILITHYYKQPILGFAFALSLVLCTRFTFYYIATEAHMVNVYAFWFFALLNYKSNKRIMRKVGIVLLIIAGAMCHPTFVFLYVFALLVFSNHFFKLERKKKFEIIFYFAIILFTVLRGVLLSQGSVKYSSAFNFSHYLLHFFDMPAIYYFYDHAFIDSFTYLPYVLLTILVIIGLCFSKKVSIAVLTISIIIFYLAVNNAVWYDGSTAIILEKTFLPLAFFTSISLCVLFKEIATSHFNKFYFSLTLISILILFLTIRNTSLASKEMKERLNLISDVYKTYTNDSCTKAIILKSVIQKYHVTTWAFPYETMLKSTLDGAEYSRTVFVEKYKGQLKELNLNNSGLVLGTYFQLKSKNTDFNPKYFHLKYQRYKFTPNKPL